MKTRAPSCLLLIGAVASCSSILPKAPAQAYYDLSYEPDAVSCASAYPAGVQVWELTASPPYDRVGMVVAEAREVSLSHGHQWVDRPGVLLAAKLLRDLNGGRIFPLAVSPQDPQGAPLELTGNLYRFAWEKEGNSARALLDVDMILRSGADPPRLLLHKRYELGSDAIAATDDAAAFARAMSGVVARFSTRLRHDLCDAAAEAARPGRSAASRRPR